MIDGKWLNNRTAQLFVIGGLLLLIPRAVGQPVVNSSDLADSATWDFDFDLFYWMLESQGLQSRNDSFDSSSPERWDRLFNDASESVVVLTGDVRRVVHWSTFHKFMAQGGVILLATNEPISVYGFFRVDYGPALVLDRSQSWQGYTDCLMVTDIQPSVSWMEDVSTIVTNRSGWIARLEGSLDYVWSPFAWLPFDLEPQESSGQPLAAMAANRDRSPGRLIVLADGSPLSNGMLWHGDNLRLLINTVQELTRDNRTEFAFLHNGQPMSGGITEQMLQQAASQFPVPDPADVSIEALADIPPEALADLPPEMLLEIGNTVATSIEDSNILNELITDRPRQLPQRFYRRAILFVVCAIALAVFVLRGWLNEHSAVPWLRKKRRPEARESPAFLSGTNYDQAAEALSRDTCRMLTGSPDSADWQQRLQPDGTTWQQLYAQSSAPQTTVDVVAKVLLWATSGSKTRLTRLEFERFGMSIHQLKQFHQP